MGELVSGQVGELVKEVKTSLAKLNTLIENRKAWADGVEGCREGATVLGYAHERLHSIGEDIKRLETALASARAELERWSKMHADLSVVERDLRAQCEQQQQVINEHGAALGRARLLVRDFVKALTKELT